MTQPFDSRDWDLRQVAEKDAEIERLKLVCTELARRIKDAEEAIQRQDNVIIEQKSLLTRAADALEHSLPKFQFMPPYYVLIAELRKAATQ